MKFWVMKRTILSLATSLAVAAPPGALAQQAGQGLRASSSVLTPDYRAVRNLDSPPQPPLPELGSATSNSVSAYSSVVDLNSYVQIEMPRDLGDGRFTRPRVRFGMQSDSLKSLANSVGLQPDRCSLPVRARSSASSDEASTSVMLFARCSFF